MSPFGQTYSLRTARTMLKAALLTAALTAACSVCSAQIATADSAQLRFRQGKWALDTAFSSNSSRLDSIITPLRRMAAAPRLYRIDSVRIIGAASPEGSAALNHRLSVHRAEVLAGRVRSEIALPDSLVRIEGAGRDWRSLLDLAGRDAALPAREATLQTLRGIIRANSGDTPAALCELQRLDGGAPYSYMYARIFPQLREARMQISYTPLLLQLGEPHLDVLVPQPDASVPAWSAPIITTSPDQRKPFYMALKTNMLYDALAVPNIGAEFYVGRHWSVVGNWMYAWWSKDSAHRYRRIYGGDIAVRRWFGRAAEEKPLTGHHLGVYGGVVTYDFEFGGRGYMGGIPGGTLWDRCQFVAGIEYGYSLPVAKRLNIDFTIGIGYRQGKRVKYDAGEKWYVWKRTDTERWIGPTKAEISLVWLIGHGNTNQRKGGAR